MSPASKRPFRSKPGRGDSFTTDLRYQFFRTVDEVAPELAAQMVEAVGPVFKGLAERLTEGDVPSFAWIAREQKELLTAWREWGQPYGLDQDSWILDHALSFLPAFPKKVRTFRRALRGHLSLWPIRSLAARSHLRGRTTCDPLSRTTGRRLKFHRQVEASLTITFGKHPVPRGLGFLTHDVSRCTL